MILIDGKPLPGGLLSSYLPGSTEHRTAEIMIASPHSYSFASDGELKFELSLRRETVSAAYALDKSGMDFEIFRKSRCNSACWDRLLDGGFRLRRGIEPARAIEDIYRHGPKYATECATAMVIVYYKAILSVFSAERFNRVFPSITLMNWHRIDPLMTGIALIRKEADYFPGDRRYFANPDVDPSTPEWQGENVIDLNGTLYYGHGVGIYKAGDIIRMLNQNRAEGADETAYLVDGAGRPDFHGLYDVYRRTPNPDISESRS